MSDYLITALRIVMIIPLVLIVTLMMGKRQISELPVFDFIVSVILGAVIGADIADPSIPHGPTVLAILLLGGLQLAFSWLAIRLRFFRQITRFEPTIVIQNGIILKHNLRKIRYSFDQLLELLRLKGVFRLSEVEFALVEPNGRLSVLKKTQEDYVKPRYPKIDTPYDGLPTPVIYEGKVEHEMLERLELSEEWLHKELAKLGYSGPQEIFYAELDTQGVLYASPLKPDLAEQKRLM